MESCIKVHITPRQMEKICKEGNEDIRYYEYLGVKKKGDFPYDWYKYKDTSCLYKIIWRHEELPRHLRGTFRTWSAAKKAKDKLVKMMEEQNALETAENTQNIKDDTAYWIPGNQWKDGNIVYSKSFCCSKCGWAWSKKDDLNFFTHCPGCGECVAGIKESS